MTLIILDEAKLEINEHVAWYAERDQAVAHTARRPAYWRNRLQTP